MTRRSSSGNTRPRVLVFAPHFAEYALRLAEGLSAGAEVLLVAEARNLAAECPPALRARVARKVGIVTFVSHAKTPLGALRRRFWVPALIRRFRPTIAHVQEQGDPFTAWLVDGLATRIPVVLTVHDPSPHSGSDNVFATYARPYLARLRKAAAGFHVHGAFCEGQLRALTAGDRPVVSTPIGVHFVPEPEALRPRSPATLLFFGRMEAYKGLEIMLDAADELRRRGQSFELILAGRGPELERLAERIADNPAIRLHNRFLPHDEAISMFQQASLVVAPYLDATQSGVVASAFANGRPVVASRTGGLVDAIEDGVTGRLVPPNDPCALADAIEPLLGDERTIEALAENVRAHAASHLAWSAIGADLLAFDQRLCAERRPNGGPS